MSCFDGPTTVLRSEQEITIHTQVTVEYAGNCYSLTSEMASIQLFVGICQGRKHVKLFHFQLLYMFIVMCCISLITCY